MLLTHWSILNKVRKLFSFLGGLGLLGTKPFGYNRWAFWVQWWALWVQWWAFWVQLTGPFGYILLGPLGTIYIRIINSVGLLGTIYAGCIHSQQYIVVLSKTKFYAHKYVFKWWKKNPLSRFFSFLLYLCTWYMTN